MDPIVKKQLEESHPNIDSPHATPTSRRIDAHYREQMILHRWTRERYIRLSGFLRVTPFELASVAGIPHSIVKNWSPRTILPINQKHGAYAVALVLTMLESHVLNGLADDIISNPFPSLTKQKR